MRSRTEIEQIYNNMVDLVWKIRTVRKEQGIEHPEHEKIWAEIDEMYKKLDREHQEEFDYFVA